jgi:hypothetical protein
MCAAHSGIVKPPIKVEIKREDFSVTFKLSDVSKIENFVAREFRGVMAKQNTGSVSRASNLRFT